MNQSMLIIRRHFSTSKLVLNAIKQVTIIGSGLMGSGIAQVSAQAGQRVNVVDISEDALAKSKKNMQYSLLRIGKKLHKDQPENIDQFVLQTFSHLTFTTDIAEAVKSTDLVVECVVENLEVKQDLFEKIEKLTSEKTILASNTSSLLISECTARVQKRDRIGGLHFFNPVAMMKLLEVIRIPDTSEETYKLMIEWGKAIGKTCITCKDTPGFVVNRLLIPYSAEAVRIFEAGVASCKDIDTAMKLGAGYPMGPFELMDYTGLDTGKFIKDGWHKRDPNNPLYQPSETINKMVKEGKLGVKSGEGFYKYTK